MRARIKDIAQRCGCSISLVSMYLNRHPLSARIAASTKQRIDEVVRQMHYSPSATARSLRQGKSKVLGLVIGDIASVFSGFYSQMLLQEADARGYQLLISLTLYDKAKEAECLRNLLSRQPDGILYTLELDSDAATPVPEFLKNYPILLTQPHQWYNLVIRDFIPAFDDAFAMMRERGLDHALLVHEGGQVQLAEAVKKSEAHSVKVEMAHFESMDQLLELASSHRTCLFFFSSISARKYLRHCHCLGLKKATPLIFAYTLPSDYFESPEVLGAMVEPFKELIPMQIGRLIEMIERPKPTLRCCSLPVRFMTPADLSKYHNGQCLDPYYRVIVEERCNNLTQDGI